VSFKSASKKRLGAKGLARVIPFWWGSRLSSILLVILSLVLFSWSSIGPGGAGHMSQTLGSQIRTKTMDLFTPILGMVSAPIEASANYVRDLTGLAALQAENARLRQENIRLREWYRTAMVMQQENAHLQALLNVKQDIPHRYITGRVVADAGNAYAKTLLVMAGYGDGVQKNHPVMSPDGVIGRVIEAGERAARVLLLTDMNARTPVFIQGLDVKAIMAGRNDNMPVLEHLPPEIELTEGASVVTSGHGGLFPYGLAVGTLLKAPSGQWAVDLYASFDHLNFVRIIDTTTDPNLLKGKLD
jgi:rod shape-determining protein MreC